MIPKVTIIMATYNREKFILETLKSIQNQTFQNWECLIIDDGGTDNTIDVISNILETDSRFKFLKRTDTYHKGLPGCRNYGLDLAQGDYIIFFDDDDIVHPMNLELCVKELENSNYSFCRYIRTVFTGDFEYNFDLSNEFTSFLIDYKDTEDLLTHKLPFNSCAIMWRKNCFNDNRFIEHLMYAEEWELYSRILSSGIKGISINKNLFFGRKHPNSNTGEFFSNNPIRKESKRDAILLVLNNLKKKNLLSESLLIYFIKMSIDFKTYHLFSAIMKIAKLPLKQQLKFHLFYRYYSFRIYIYRLKLKLIS